ncbi:patatin-like phospholipase family protein [Bradyrhizobium liaoningense]|uniref:patatin-like phospholipase family protein n=1 Tax=Bradyrhizobium liaoningense TaxID=43992 RepID=UPI001BA5B538|nr:patatin-like phospholipase family protein [Bradyrhizobium liaoningense]MBR0706236.1 patatin-like phospholipase family protein [Bradyrhizobium liaoningense]
MSQSCHRLFPLSYVVLVLSVLVGCTSPRTSYTASEASSARILNLADLRLYADAPISRARGDKRPVMLSGPQIYLALSGGGADGAYGAGVLNGWTETGTRPSFSIVSGVSTGALIAPFAFLGSDYDATLRDLYTSGVAESLLDAPNPLNAIFGSSVFGNTRLRELVAKYIDAKLVDAVATEYAKGRLLFVVTTNLDSQRSVIWDLGRIASLRSLEGLHLFRDVITASASLPVVFPPMPVAAEANGKQFEELHVDGGVSAPVLTLPEAFLVQTAKPARIGDLQLFVLINNKVEREFQIVPNNTIEIAARSSSTMTKAQTRAIINSTYAFARRNKFEFNLTYIEGDRPASPSSGFDTAYMRALFQYGYDRARNNRLWSKSPPANGLATPSALRPELARLLATKN